MNSRQSRKRKSQIIISEFIDLDIPIAKINWKKAGYKTKFSCYNTLVKSIEHHSFPIEITTINREIYIFNPNYIKTI